MEKSPDAFKTISEAAQELDIPQHVLRFWETRFSTIKPLKRGGGRRYYRPEDVELLWGIKHLLYAEGYTIKGVQRILKEKGARFVMEIRHHPGRPVPKEHDLALHEDTEERELRLEEGESLHPSQEKPISLPSDILPEDVPGRSGLRFIDRLRGAAEANEPLSREDIRRLQSTLAELLECKRLLDQVR